ncbi:MAG: adenine phosphoribosyltransferase [Candidatus Poseidoniaceae archaeon]|jgi:adenine phosphoribosyltransferase|nr:adenine phosphoribosyltransferase [Candidatus Poseidoniaceae archaeon]
MDLKEHIRGIPDFPIPGILFYDISTILANPEAWSHTIDLIEKLVLDLKPDVIAGIEARGFLLASAIADRTSIPMVMIRKAGKLPGDVISHTYELEYGSDTIEMQSDALKENESVLILDDLLATGGTIAASINLCEKFKANILGCCFIVELDFLKGREMLEIPVFSLVNYNE